MRNKIDFYARILIALVVALLSSELLAREVFVGSTPRVRPDLADSLVTKTLTLVNIDNLRNLLRKAPSSPVAVLPKSGKIKTAEQAKQELATMPFTPTGIKGVYAKDTEDAGMVEMRLEEVDWVTVFYEQKDGSIIQLRIPRGTNPPPSGLF